MDNKSDGLLGEHPILQFPQHCYICERLIRKTEVMQNKITGALISPGVGVVLVHRACALERWGKVELE